MAGASTQSGETVTTRFSVIDEFAHLADFVGAFIAMHFEVKVAGVIDVAVLRRAVAEGASRHPMALAASYAAVR